MSSSAVRTHEPVSVALSCLVLFARDHWWGLLAVGVFLTPVVTYGSIVVGNWWSVRSRKDGRAPPVVPYWVPFVGSLFAIGLNPFRFLSEIRYVVLGFLWFNFLYSSCLPSRHPFSRFYPTADIPRRDIYGPSVPVGVKMGPLQSYLISSASAFMSLTKSSQHLTPKPAIAVAMENVFGTPPGAIHVYKEDDSGITPTPLAGTNVEPKKRIWYHHSKAAHTYLSGKSLQALGARFMDLLGHDIATDESIGTEWVDQPDLYVFWQDQIFEAALGALFGPHLLRLNPTFTRDFWNYVGGMSTLMMGLPKWMTPGSWAKREKVLEGIKRWHRFAVQHCDPAKEAGGKDWDEYWGSTYLKARYSFVSAIPVMTEDAHAADDLALMVA